MRPMDEYQGDASKEAGLICGDADYCQMRYLLNINKNREFLRRLGSSILIAELENRGWLLNPCPTHRFTQDGKGMPIDL